MTTPPSICYTFSITHTLFYVMQQDTFTRTSGGVFLVIMLFHLARVVQGWEGTINGWAIPMWFSYLAVLVTGYMAVNGLRLGKK